MAENRLDSFLKGNFHQMYNKEHKSHFSWSLYNISFSVWLTFGSIKFSIIRDSLVKSKMNGMGYFNVNGH